MKMKRVLAVMMSAAMVVGLAACGGGGSSSGGGDSASGGDGAGITIFNSKMEIQSQMEEMAEKYSEEKGVPVEVYYSSDTVAAHLATKYASNDPYTISMVDAKDVYSLAEEHALDLTGEGWVDKTTQAISIGDKVYGFPVCIEARGIIYNADAIKEVTGEDFDPSAIKTKADFEDICQKLIDGGMEAPTGVMKEDWSLGAHYLAQVYEEQADPDAFIAGIKDGSVDLASDEKFNSLMDTFDVLKDNNYAKDAAISAEREVTEQKLAEGEIAFMFGGNWDWSVINAYDYSENMGMMPVPRKENNDLLVIAVDRMLELIPKVFYQLLKLAIVLRSNVGQHKARKFQLIPVGLQIAPPCDIVHILQKNLALLGTYEDIVVAIFNIQIMSINFLCIQNGRAAVNLVDSGFDQGFQTLKRKTE